MKIILSNVSCQITHHSVPTNTKQLLRKADSDIPGLNAAWRLTKLPDAWIWDAPRRSHKFGLLLATPRFLSSSGLRAATKSVHSIWPAQQSWKQQNFTKLLNWPQYNSVVLPYKAKVKTVNGGSIPYDINGQRSLFSFLISNSFLFNYAYTHYIPHPSLTCSIGYTPLFGLRSTDS